ncbi:MULTISPECIES: hypothetical protein [Bradyrhizobium]|uniref:hypothetical protein n=1 Tax=Bradyrhizobium pachyrhizi TaxID=280333 RepID=UPI000401D8DB
MTQGAKIKEIVPLGGRESARAASASAAIRIDTPDCFEGYLKFLIMLSRSGDRERRVSRQHGSWRE